MNKKDLDALYAMGQKARSAARILAKTSRAQKDKALERMAEALLEQKETILSANEKDIFLAQEAGRSKAMVDRLCLNEERLLSMAKAVKLIAEMDDPVGEVMEEWERPNGLKFRRVRTALGVIGMIYESRPNVTIDAASLCLKSGNATILRGGSDAFLTSMALYEAIRQGLESANLPMACVQMVQMRDRAAVGAMLSGLEQTIDVIIPRGGKSLVERVQQEARVPVFAHLEGVCHLYVDKSAALEKAIKIVLNAKMRRTGICGAAETLLFDKACKQDFMVAILDKLNEAGCQLRVTDDILAFYDKAVPAKEDDFGKEFLDAILAVKLVDGVDGAIAHIDTYSSHHTEAIIAEEKSVVETFFHAIDSAILLHNASTQFADGGEFGFGAEIGIATGKMHARGPIALKELTSFQYHIYGDGQIRG